MAKRVPVTTFITTDSVQMFAAVTLCGQSWAGMVNTPDLEIQMRKALTHAEQCAVCIERWTVISTDARVRKAMQW